MAGRLAYKEINFIFFLVIKMLIEIESFYGNKLISGKKCTGKELRSKFKEAIKMADTDNFTVLFCRLFQFEEIPFDDNDKVDYVIDLDTYLVYKPRY